MPNRTSAIIESQIMNETQKNPLVSYIKLAELMKRDGFAVTPTMIRYVWQRHHLSTRFERLHWAKKRSRLAESQDQRNPRGTLTQADRCSPPLGDMIPQLAPGKLAASDKGCGIKRGMPSDV
jgi:hypothetical protein